jgi:hypothetical protein
MTGILAGNFSLPACDRSATRMKAEQRRELETNALADRMGHLVQRMKTQPRRSTVYYVVGVLLLIVVVFVVWRWFRMSQLENANRWEMINVGSAQYLDHLKEKESETNPGKAAKFQIAWYRYWDLGVKRLGIGGGMEGIKQLDASAAEYRKLAEECTGDKLWEPEAMYGLAVIEETKAVMNLDALDRAKGLYENLKAKYPESARGKLADEWLQNADNKEKFAKLREFYQELHTSLNIIDFEALNRQLRQNQNLLAPKKENPAK